MDPVIESWDGGKVERRSRHPSPRRVCLRRTRPVQEALNVILWFWLLLPAELLGGTVRTQEISLRAGWNAVHLEVQPASSKPLAVFGALPVQVVAAYWPGSQAEAYLRVPGDAPWKEDGWRVWYAPATEDSFLSNLNDIQAGRSYLIQAREDFRWTISGEARAAQIDWAPQTCTFTGLPVEPGGRLTLAEFFAGSPAHERLRVFRLEQGRWQQVKEPAAHPVVAGEAYWIQTDGASRHPGPFRVVLPASGILDFGGLGTRAALTLENVGATAARPRVEVHGGPATLRLLRWQSNLRTLAATTEPLPAVLELPELAAGKRMQLTLLPDRGGLAEATGSTLLRIADGRGWETWVPVFARRE